MADAVVDELRLSAEALAGISGVLGLARAGRADRAVGVVGEVFRERARLVGDGHGGAEMVGVNPGGPVFSAKQ